MRKALALLCFVVVFVPAIAQSSRPETAQKHDVEHSSQLSFEPNRGQVDEQARFLARGAGHSLELLSADAAMMFTASRMQLSFAGTDPLMIVEGIDELPGKVHYLVGRLPEHWITRVPTYAGVAYRNIYPGIDLTYRGRDERLEIELTVAPGADPNSITFQLDGPETVDVDAVGDLILRSGRTALRQLRPVVRQDRLEVAANYFLLDGRSVGFGLEQYDPDKPLIISIGLVPSKPAGISVEAESVGVAVNDDGDTFVAGRTAGRADAFVIKLDSDGSTVASTYFGGNGEDVPLDMATGPDGGVILVGRTTSTDFPTANAFNDELSGASDAFVARLTPDGSGLVYSTLLGGSGDDEVRGIALDDSSNAWIAGQTASFDFPVTSTLLQPVPGGRSDAFVAQLSSDGALLVHSGYLGGSEDDLAEAIAVGPAGDVYLAGTTRSKDLPFTGSESGGSDVFVVRIEPDTGTLAFSAYLGGTDDDGVTGIALDPSGNPYVTGWTRSTDFPITSEAMQGILGGSVDGFLAKFSAEDHALVYSTYIGGRDDDRAHGILVGPQGIPWLAGTTGSTDFPLIGTPDPRHDRLEGFVFMLHPESLIPVRSTYLGGDGDDSVTAIALDSSGQAVVAGTTASTGPLLFQKLEFTAAGDDVFVSTLLAAGCPGTINFDNDSGDLLWQTATNWDSDSLPALTDDVCIGAFDVTVGTSQTVQSLTVEAAGSLTLSGGTLTLSSASQIDGNFTQSGGTLSGAGDLTIAGTFNWTAGTHGGSGATNADGGLSMTGSNRTLGRTINNSATATYNLTNSGMLMGAGAVFNNMAGATFDAQNDTNLTYNGGSPVFINAGAFIKSGGTGTTTLNSGIAFANDGSVDVQSGTLELRVTATHTGSFDSTGATLSFNGGTHTLSAAQTITGTDVLFDSGTVNLLGGYNIAGTTTVAGGTANFTGSITDIGTLVMTSGTTNLSNTEGVVTQPTFTMSAGTLTGSSDLTVTGLMQWTGGTLTGSGAINAQGGLSMTGSNRTLGRTINNSATATYNLTNSGMLMGAGAVFNNMAGATFDAQNDTNLTYNGGSPVFINAGAFIKSGGTGTTTLNSGIAFANDGSVDVQSGTLELRVTATHTGSFDSTGATLSFNGGTHTLSAAQTITGTDVLFDSGTVNLLGGYNIAGTTTVAGGTANFTGSITDIGTLVMTSGTTNLSNTEGVVTQPTFTMSAGTLTGSSDLTVTGLMEWTGGTLTGSGAVNAQGGLSMTGSNKSLNRTINNSATATYNLTNSGMLMGAGAVFNNMAGATFDAQNDTNLTYNGGSPVFINAGAFIKSGGTGTTVLSNGIAFANDGSVDVQSGTLELHVTATHTGSFDSTGATLSFNGGTHTLSAAQTITGTDVLFDSGTVNLLGGYNIAGTTTVAGGTANFTGSITDIGTLVMTSGTTNLSNTEGVVTQPTFTMSAGTLTGSSDLTVTGLMEWTGGTLTGSGAVNAQGGLSMTGSNKNLNRTINNSATATYNLTNSGLLMGSGAVFNNMAGATFDAQNDTNLTYNGGSPVFINAGAFIKSGGTGTTVLSNGIAFANDGSVDVQSGTLELHVTATHTGSFDSTGATLSFDGGTHDLSAATTITGTNVIFDTGTVNLSGGYNVTGTTFIAGGTANFTGSITSMGDLNISSGTANLSNTEGSVPLALYTHASGTLSGSSAVNLTGPAIWSGGTQSGTGVTNILGGLTLSGSSTKTLGRTMNNSTSVIQAGTGHFYLTTNGVFNNLTGGTFDIQTDADVTRVGGTPTFNNSGTLKKSAGAATTAFGSTLVLTNTGAVEALSGTLSIVNYTQTAGSTTVNGGLLTTSNDLDIQGGVVTGIGSVTADAVDSAGQVAPGLPLGVLAITGNYTQQAAGALQIELDGIGCTVSDRLDVSGAVTVDGTLDVTLTGGCEPIPGQSFTLITAGSVFGAFTNFTPPTTSCPVDWNVAYNAGSIVLEVVTGTCLDGDGDTFSDCCGTCAPDIGDSCFDCDDADPLTYQGAPELCDGTDNDCDTILPANEIDDDGDLYVECPAWNDTQGNAPTILGGDDCDDADLTSFPGSPEVCDGNDNDCDTVVPAGEIDDDVDLYVDCSGWNDTQSDQPTILGGDDCDDGDAASFPGGAELCDGNDNDCNSSIPDDEIDGDGDSYVECSGWSDTQADQPAILGGDDCDDLDATSFPGGAELCDGNDNDCDTVVPAGELDGDGDSYVECSGWSDSQGDQPTILGGADCDDLDVTSFPGGAELCDGNDNDCDTVVPAGEIDDDVDSYVDCSGWNDTQGDQLAILGGDDCDDDDAASFPGGAELCDGNDNDCNSTIPDDEIDGDADSYVECSGWSDTQADQPAILGGGDCDDLDATSFPGGAELCDGNDNDCDTVVPADEIDSDGDFYVQCSVWNDTQGDQPLILSGVDCLPADPLINPGALEVCDGNDNDCSGTADDGDADSDTFLVCADCDDGNGLIHAIPSAVQNVLFQNVNDLQWDPPSAPGGSVVNYDTIRSSNSTDFVGASTCVESDDGSDTVATDSNVPAVGSVFYYLARAQNDCGAGSAGTDSDIQERVARSCP